MDVTSEATDAADDFSCFSATQSRSRLPSAAQMLPVMVKEGTRGEDR